jgi:hypothetical protein
MRLHLTRTVPGGKHDSSEVLSHTVRRG